MTDEAVSSDSDSDSDSARDEDPATVSCDSNASGSQVHVQSRPQHPGNPGGDHFCTGGPCALRILEASLVNKDPSPITIFLLFFMEVISCWWQRLTNTTVSIWTNLTLTVTHGYQT